MLPHWRTTLPLLYAPLRFLTIFSCHFSLRFLLSLPLSLAALCRCQSQCQCRWSRRVSAVRFKSIRKQIKTFQDLYAQLSKMFKFVYQRVLIAPRALPLNVP